MERSSWERIRSVEAWAGEVRLNVIRFLAVFLFYLYHLADYYWLHHSQVDRTFHQRVSLVVLIWALAVFAMHVLMQQQARKTWLHYLATLVDAGLITVLLAITQSFRGPLVMLYLLVIAAAPLRLSILLVYVATASAIFGYLVAVGYYAYVVIGFESYYADGNARIPRSEQIVVTLSFVVAGLLAGQVVRQLNRILLNVYSPAAETHQ